MDRSRELYLYSGCKNIFLAVIDEGRFPENDRKLISSLCQEVDGLLILRSSNVADVKMIYLNKDGSRASMCGNGLRCVAHLARRKLFPERTSLCIETDVGVRKATIDGDLVEVEMGQLVTPEHFHIKLDRKEEEIFFLNTGVPHAVIKENDIAPLDVYTRGKKIRYHPAFQPEGTNVTFTSICEDESCDVCSRTYERGVEAETFACGTGAVAAAVVMWDRFPSHSALKVRCQSGELLTVRKHGSFLFLKGAVSQL